MSLRAVLLPASEKLVYLHSRLWRKAKNPAMPRCKEWVAGSPGRGPLAGALLRTTIWKVWEAKGLDPTDRTHATPIPDSAPRSRGPRSGQELLVTALAPVLCQALCCMLDTLFSLNFCQALRGGMFIPVSQVKKLRLGRMYDLPGVRQPISGSRDSNPGHPNS